MPGFFLFGKDCPRSLQKALHDGKFVYDLVDIVKPLQCTTSCSVSLCSCSAGLCVVKSYHKHRLDETELSQVTLELQLHHQLSTRHVVPFWAAVNDGNQLHIVMHYASQGDLRSILRQGPLSEAFVREQVVMPLLQALVELHSKGYVHRDLKPDNVFMTDSGGMLGDFSLAVGPLPASHPSMAVPPAHSTLRSACRYSNDSSISLAGSSSDSLADSDRAGSADSGPLQEPTLSLGSSGSILHASSFTGQECQAGGTPAYCAPEVVLAAFNNTPMCEALGPQNDVWALGMLTAECLLGEHLLGDAAAASGAVLHTIIGSRPLPLSQLPVSAEAKDWLAAALAKDPQQRWSAQQLLKHTWITATPMQPSGRTADAAAAAAPGQETMHSGCWEQGRDVAHKQQQQQPDSGLCHRQAHASPATGAVPPWVDDDWVSGLNSMVQSRCNKDGAWSTRCGQQEVLQLEKAAAATALLQPQGKPLTILSWED